MAKHYSVKDFFRQMPNTMLARYFHVRNLFLDLDFVAMKKCNPDELFTAWLLLSDEQRKVMDAELKEIHEMCSDKGFQAILDEASWQLRADAEAFDHFTVSMAALPNHYERVMATFLDHSHFWRGATRFYHADSLPYWRKRKNMRYNVAAIDESSLQQLADLVRIYFHHTEGRGNNCIVEPFRRGDLDYFFAYPEDYSQHSIEWVNGEFGRRPHNPAFEIIYVYSQREGSLDINFRGSRKAIEPLQGMFASAILKLDELPPDPKDERVYDLTPLLKKTFDFSFPPGSGIDEVTVKKVRLSSRIKKGDRITLEADTSKDSQAVYSLLEQMGQALPLVLYSVTQVELAATVAVDVHKPPRKVTIRLTHPNSCSLKYDDIGLRLRDMLEASGIELKDLEPDAEEEQLESELVEA